MDAKKHYTVRTPNNRTWKRWLTEDEVKDWTAKGYKFEEIEKTSVVPNRRDLRAKGLRAQRTGKGTSRVSSGTPTGKGSIFRFMEQQFRPNGRTRGQKIVQRFGRQDGK